MVFIDDILIYSKNQEEHALHLRIVLTRLREHKLYAKFNKYEFWLDRVQFLGHVLTTECISVDPSKVQDVLNWKSQSECIRSVSSLVLLVIIGALFLTSPKWPNQ